MNASDLDLTSLDLADDLSSFAEEVRRAPARDQGPVVTYFTTAPAAYDYDTVIRTEEEFDLGRWGSPYGKVDRWRRIVLKAEPFRLEYQLGRFRSGVHAVQQIDPRVQQAEWAAEAARDAARLAAWDASVAAASTVAELKAIEHHAPLGHKKGWLAKRDELALAEDRARRAAEAAEAWERFKSWVREQGGDPEAPVLCAFRGPAADRMKQVSVVRAAPGLEGGKGLVLTGAHGAYDQTWQEFWSLAALGCWCALPAGTPVPSPAVWKAAADVVVLIWHEGTPYWMPEWMTTSPSRSYSGRRFYDSEGTVIHSRANRELFLALDALVRKLGLPQDAPYGTGLPF